MPINVAVQMDPMETIRIAGDSSFAIMLAGQARGHKLWHYDVDTLAYRAGGRLTAQAQPVNVQHVEGDHHRFDEIEEIDLGGDIDVVLMRQDPPFDLSYITATHLLERIQPGTLVVNDPAAVRNAPEKLFVLDYRRVHAADPHHPPAGGCPRFPAPSIRRVVVKPLYGNAGSAVFHDQS